jgi:SAM-dependent methyltransferase
MRQSTITRLDALNRASYDVVADDFNVTRQNVWPELFPVTTELKAGQIFLDVGCGNGRLLKRLPADVDYIGIDGSLGLLEHAKKTSVALKRTRDQFKSWSPLDGPLPFADESIDRIANIAFLHHIPSRKLRRQVLTECHRVLKRGGTMYLTCWRLWNRKYIDLVTHYGSRALLQRNGLELGDVIMPYTRTDRSKTVERYYHGYYFAELLRDVRAAGFHQPVNMSSPRNYVLFLTKR